MEAPCIPSTARRFGGMFVQGDSWHTALHKPTVGPMWRWATPRHGRRPVPPLRPHARAAVVCDGTPTERGHPRLQPECGWLLDREKQCEIQLRLSRHGDFAHPPTGFRDQPVPGTDEASREHVLPSCRLGDELLKGDFTTIRPSITMNASRLN